MLEDFETYLSKRVAPTTLRLRMFWVRKFAGTCDPECTPDDLYDFLHSNPDWSPNTQQTIVSSLKVFYRWAHSNGHVTSNPALELQHVRIPRKVSRIAADSVIREGLGNATIVEEAMLRLGAEGGLRVSEIAHLRTSARDGEWLTVTGKGGHTRTVHIEQELSDALDFLERNIARWGYYFPGRYREPIAPSTVWRHIRSLTGLNSHSLRHRAGTVVYRSAGYDLRLAQEFLGHSSPTTTAIYVHVEREQLQRASAATRLSAA